MFKDQSQTSLPPEETKAERTRRKVFDTAMTLFRGRGFDETTMRDISKDAGMALGTAYYHFPSKEAIISAYYESTQSRHHAYVTEHLAECKTLQERLHMVFHSKLEQVQGDRRMLGAIFKFNGDPKHPLSVLGDETRELQRQSVATLALALRGERLGREVAELLPLALWALQMGLLLYLLYDSSEGQRRTFRLMDQSLALTVQLLGVVRNPLLGPVVTPILRQVGQMLDDAQISLKDRPPILQELK
ncbi:TetR/AcrR family transcriptional regulator [Deinococcus arenicola]|uniref:TetR/AcrR family transcriptional regulator n=1 Tax=Deinococcus arenicola TaxID=2994950 RepID=A0ABU4DV07_9DEIO|nr:TetR/AcrR family transcriptional regulator [Deinococcus sp. ZS9-10]MDV6375787.1 TetR/AcrR family transcriptional regulator [Deinococcus sp. ZS9-10]